MAHYSIKDKSPIWGSVNKSTLPIEAFAYPHAMMLAGKMTEKKALYLPKSEWKLSHHWESEGKLWAHPTGVQLALQAMGAGLMGQKVKLPASATSIVRAHLNQHLKGVERVNTKKAKQKKVITAEQALDHLEQIENNDTTVLDIEGLARCIESQEEALTQLCTSLDLEEVNLKNAQSQIEKLVAEKQKVEKLTTDLTTSLTTIKTLETERDTIKSEKEKTDTLFTLLTTERDTLQATVNTRHKKLVSQIVGKHELVGHDKLAVEAFKTRAEKLTFDELDAEMTTITKQLEESWGPAIRISQPADGVEALTRPLNLAKLQGFRV